VADSIVDEIIAVEQRRPIRETPAERLARELAHFSVSLLRLGVLALILAPFVVFSFLMLDVPVESFDSMFNTPALKPSNWLTVGHVAISGVALIAIIIGRRFGGDEASRAVTAAWGVAAVVIFAELTNLAPDLQDSDFPSARFTVGFASAMLGQYVAIAVYDVARGAGAWWRAPLIAALTGFTVQTVIFYFTVFWAAKAPWINWMIADFGVKALLAFLFLPVYRLLRTSIRPLGGFGGR
jgi:hypothetical protein